MEHEPIDAFESKIRELVRPLNGQYPRPWMTDLTDPRQAEVFVVGYNQANAYLTHDVSLERHVNALFNRPVGACRCLYDELRRKRPRSRRGPSTRTRTEELVGKLRCFGVHDILETNVICYSTPRAKDVRRPEHARGVEQGKNIFRFLLRSIDVQALIVHGVEAVKELTLLPRAICRIREQVDYDEPIPIMPQAEKVRESRRPPPLRIPGRYTGNTRHGEVLILTIGHLAPYQWNVWSKEWARDPLTWVAEEVAGYLRG